HVRSPCDRRPNRPTTERAFDTSRRTSTLGWRSHKRAEGGKERGAGASAPTPLIVLRGPGFGGPPGRGSSLDPGGTLPPGGPTAVRLSPRAAGYPTPKSRG